MYKNYQQTPAYQQQKCSYEIYRKQCRYLHISTAKLGHEECEACILLTDQEQLAEHKRLAERAREEYQKDKERQLREDEALYTLDMQKIVCLPRLLQYKQLVFCKTHCVSPHTRTCRRHHQGQAYHLRSVGRMYSWQHNHRNNIRATENDKRLATQS